MEVFSIGGSDITNDIALGLKNFSGRSRVHKTWGYHRHQLFQKKLEEIISARLGDIFELIEVHLKKNGKSGLLPAGIIVTGGSSSIGLIEDLARSYLHLPARIASLCIGNDKFQIKDSSWSVAYGLCIIGNLPEEEERLGLKKQSQNIFKKCLKL